MNKLFLLVATLLVVAASSNAQVNARLMRYPDVSNTHITFVYAGDIWIVEKNGGTAARLSSPPGEESYPKFSPDGQSIAFSGNYNGNTDIYTIPVTGGVPKRITFHGDPDRVVGWYPDGKSILFASYRESGRLRFNRLFKIDKEGGLPEVLPPAYAENGSLSPDGNQLAFTDKSRLTRTWKRYRGGMAPDITVMDLTDLSTENITNSNANEELPMWYDNSIYFLSDNGPKKRMNIWEYNLDSKSSVQLTKFKDFDAHYPSIGSNNMVFEAGGDLYLMNLESKKYKKVIINVITDQMAILPKAKKVEKYIQHGNISPDGKRVLVEARGDIFSLPAEKGYISNLNQSSGSAERFPAWSPDGKQIAFWSDASGEYELTLYDTEKSTTKKITNLGPGYRYEIYWSPNGKQIAYVDQTMNINICNTETGANKVIDKGLWLYQGGLESFSVSWSSDSKWLTWSRGAVNRNAVVFIYDTEKGSKTQVTSDFYNNFSPRFDPEGKYLYLLTNRSMRPTYSNFDQSFIYNKSTLVAAITLEKDTPSPLAPENDEVEIKKEEKKDEKAETDEAEKSEDKAVKIDFDGMENRLVLLPVKAGSYRNLEATKGKIIFQDFTNAAGSGGKRPVVYWDLKDKKQKTIVDNAQLFIVSADGKKMLVADKNKFSVIDVKEKQKMEKFVPVQDMEMNIIPKEEWQQIFTEAWRLERDFFYDKNMHGVDWDAMRTKYEKLLKQAVSREDVNFLLGELIGELNSSHTYKGGGDLENAKRRNVGYLGIDWKVNNGQYQIAKIIEGAKWDAEARSPLAAPGVKISAGDYILAINGIKLSVEKEPEVALQGLGGKTVELTVSKTGAFDDAEKVIVKTLSSDKRLRHLAWIESKRKRVEEATGGKVGYIYVRSTGIDGQNELARQFYGQWQKEALIVDERFNSGGQIPDRFIEMLNRKPIAYWAVRDGHQWQEPTIANFGPKAMLINGWSGSGGDAFPDYFKKAGLGPLIGTKTWGGLIGMTGSPQFIDGGTVSCPSFRMFDPDGKWFREGLGVEPDIKVPEDHSKLATGVDNQLEKAIEWILDELKKNPTKVVKPEPIEKR